MGANVAVWWIDFGWGAAVEAIYNYSAGFAFTIAFTLITKRALDSRAREEKLRLEIESAHEQLKVYAATAEDLATTRERNRVAREIHDGVGHYLTVVKTQLDAAAALIPTQPDRARDAVVKAAKLTGEALDDVRRSVGALRTDTARPPLPAALKQLATLGEPVPALAVEGTPRPLPTGRRARALPRRPGGSHQHPQARPRHHRPRPPRLPRTATRPPRAGRQRRGRERHERHRLRPHRSA
jgi:signal transduction histidine kinase